MERATLNSLPTEIVDLIVDSLHDSHPPATFLLSLVNRQLRCATSRALFKNIVIRGEDVHSLECIPRTAPMREYIKCLTIKDGHSLNVGNPPTNTTELWEGDQAWLLLANFISELPSLSDVIYDAGGAFFPQCLARALGSMRTRINLHIRSPVISLTYDPETNETEGDQMPVFKSPFLKSAVLRFEMSQYGGIDPNEDLSPLDLVSRLAPGLENVSFVVDDVRGYPLGSKNDRDALVCSPSQSMDASSGQILVTGLHFNKLQPLEEELVKHIGKTVDFAQLQTLKLSGFIGRFILHFLACYQLTSSLKCLKLELVDRIKRRERDLSDWYMMQHAAKGIEYYASLQAFLRSLPSLSALKLHGYFSFACWRAAILYHGNTLRKLSLRQDRSLGEGVQMRSAEIGLIAENCRHIEILKIATRRFKGDQKEVLIYYNLGRFPRLKKLCLTLDAASSRMTGQDLHDAYNWNFESNWYNALINCALDQSLACSIFHIINESRRLESILMHGTDQSTPLQNLIVEVASPMQDWGRVPREVLELGQIIEYMSRQWCVRWDTRAYLPYKVIAERSIPFSGRLPEKLSSRSEQIFRHVWPEHKSDRKCWNDDWCSFPLHGNFGEERQQQHSVSTNLPSFSPADEG